MLTILQGDAIEQLRTLPDESVHCCVTSPPYWSLRDYSCNGQLGLEKTPEEYVAKMVEVFREVRRVLRKDGTLWLNLGDSYASASAYDRRSIVGNGSPDENCKRPNRLSGTLKEKDLIGIPWRVAFALQADGWWLRSDIIWAKPNPMPESVTDRPTKAHEYLFLLTKSANYFYDAEAIKERSVDPEGSAARYESAFSGRPEGETVCPNDKDGQRYAPKGMREFNGNRNKRSVWAVATAPYADAHFATYPPDLIKPCILAGTSAKGCCAKCGSPWERIVERGETTMRTQNDGKGYVASTSQDMQGMRKGILPNAHTDIITKYWQQSCRCLVRPLQQQDWTVWGPSYSLVKNPIPCTVLDPFAGSGTTGAVALELGRKAILIELNPKYVALIRQRCNITPGLQLA